MMIVPAEEMEKYIGLKMEFGKMAATLLLEQTQHLQVQQTLHTTQYSAPEVVQTRLQLIQISDKNPSSSHHLMVSNH